MRKSWTVVAVALFLLVALGASAQEATTEKAPRPPKPVNLYRLDFVIHESEDGKLINTRHYSQLIDAAGDWSRVRAGARVPITTDKGMQYMDVGMRIDYQLTERDAYVGLELRLEISNFAQGQATQDPQLRTISSDVKSALLPGKPTVVSSIDDTASKHRYELEVTATKMK
ncbi:MAG: hypothetical protein ACRD35_09575 [Candidatus Acidiferrales bacterium]